MLSLCYGLTELVADYFEKSMQALCNRLPIKFDNEPAKHVRSTLELAFTHSSVLQSACRGHNGELV